VPKKFLKKENISKLNKRVLSGILRKDDDVFLVIKLNGQRSDKPTFRWETRLVKV